MTRSIFSIIVGVLEDTKTQKFYSMIFIAKSYLQKNQWLSRNEVIIPLPVYIYPLRYALRLDIMRSNAV